MIPVERQLTAVQHDMLRAPFTLDGPKSERFFTRALSLWCLGLLSRTTSSSRFPAVSYEPTERGRAALAEIEGLRTLERSSTDESAWTTPTLVSRHVGECGCPEESYLLDGFDLSIHWESNGDVDAFLDGGDEGEASVTYELAGSDEEAGRRAIFAWASYTIHGPRT